MKRFVILGLLLVFSLPVGFSIAGCAGSNPNNYCNKTGRGYGLKTNQVANISLPGNTTGISLAFGQTGQLQSPSATNCNGGAESVASYAYGSTNLNLVDVSSTGALCGGTWNRHSPGGIPDFTICTAPTAAAIAAGCSGSGATTCVVQMTASAAGVTSNTVPVWVHPSVTTIQLSVADPTTGAAGYQGCLSQNQTSQLDAIAYVSTSATTPFCAPPDTPGVPASVPDCSVNLGHFTYTPVSAAIATIDQYGVATAHQPGSTAVTAAIANVSSTAGNLYTCPPASITLAIPSDISANPIAGTVTPGTNVPLTTTILDTQGNQITGLALDYSSTNPLEISVGSGGAVSTTYPQTAAITAVCNPPTCNPSLITQIGQLGNGLPVASNSVRLTSTGRTSTYLWMASPQSDFFEAVDLTTGTIGSPTKLPYIPNSMVLDPGGNNLFFGNYRELMEYNATNNSLTKEDTTVPGVVLAVSPDSSTVVIADQVRQVIYLYTVSSAAHTTIGGLATRAQYSPDGKTLYVAGPNALYIHNTFTGWSVYPNLPTQTGAGCSLNNNDYTSATAPFTPFCSPDLAVTIPSEGAFLTGPALTSAYTFCPNTTVAPAVYYPSALAPGTVLPATDHITATTDRVHILGANPTALSDIYLGTADAPGVPIESNASDPALNGTCSRPTANNSSGLLFQATALPAQPLPVTAAAIDQVVASPDSSVAFVTYTAPAGTASPLLPAYTISSIFGEAGTLSAVKLAGTATSPLAGAFSPDNTTFFVGTAGDNLVHYIDVQSLTDTNQINPGLVDPSGNPVPIQFLATKPRPTT